MRELAERIAEAVFRVIEREQRIVKDDLIEAAERVLVAAAREEEDRLLRAAAPPGVADWLWDPDTGVWQRAAEVPNVEPAAGLMELVEPAKHAIADRRPRDWRWFEM